MVSCTLVFSTALLVSRANSPALSHASSLLCTVAREYRETAWLRGGDRFPGGATLFISDPGGRRAFVPAFAASADPDVSFDGTHVLFAGKAHAGDHWQIWEIGASGGRPRQITRCDDDCVRPLYVQPDAAVYARRASGKFVLELGRLNDPESRALPLTYAPASALPDDVLRDGRVLFSAAAPLDASMASELYTVYPDGSGVESYRCDHGVSRQLGRQLRSSDVVFARDGHLYRFTSALSHDLQIAAPPGVYAGDVAEMRDGSWIVSWHGTPSGTFELRRWKPGTPALDVYFAVAAAHVVQPVLVTARRIPDRHPSGLHEWPYGNLLCLKAYASKHHFADGSIASVKLYAREASGAPQLLGAAPVEEDGSFFIKVPGDRPLRLELLDRAGRILHSESGWFWVRSGEQRVCVGCHAGPETAPENAVPAILLRSTTPSDLTGAGSRSVAGGH